MIAEGAIYATAAPLPPLLWNGEQNGEDADNTGRLKENRYRMQTRWEGSGRNGEEIGKKKREILKTGLKRQELKK